MAARYHFRIKIPVFRTAQQPPVADAALELDSALVRRWLVAFLSDEIQRKRGIEGAVIGLSGGVDSAVVAFLCAEALGKDNVYCFNLPYKTSSSSSGEHAELVAEQLGVQCATIAISPMVDGYVDEMRGTIDQHRVGNVCARCRMTVLFDQSAALGALPVGTGNKTERCFGYFTWHGDDAPPINPLGDLYKTQVIALARELGVPDVIVQKPPTADLVPGQSDEEDLGITYDIADRILIRLLRGHTVRQIENDGFSAGDVELVRVKVSGTHWKRHLPTVAMLSDTSINDYYLRPVDYTGVKNPQ